MIDVTEGWIVDKDLKSVHLNNEDPVVLANIKISKW